MVQKKYILKNFLGHPLVTYTCTGKQLHGPYYAQWNRYYILYDHIIYLLIFVHGFWYIYQREWNQEDRQFEGGFTTHFAPSVLRLNPDLNRFEGELLTEHVICPI